MSDLWIEDVGEDGDYEEFWFEDEIDNYGAFFIFHTPNDSGDRIMGLPFKHTRIM